MMEQIYATGLRLSHVDDSGVHLPKHIHFCLDQHSLNAYAAL